MREVNNKFYIWGLLGLSILISSNSFAQEKIILGVHPYLERAEIKKRFENFAKYLSDNLPIKVDLVISSDYESHIRAVGSNKYDIAIMGPLSYVKMVEKYGKKRLYGRLQIRGSAFFQGKIITKLSLSALVHL